MSDNYLMRLARFAADVLDQVMTTEHIESVDVAASAMAHGLTRWRRDSHGELDEQLASWLVELLEVCAEEDADRE